MALKEEIFDQNSTLFSILDENEVTEIGVIANSVNQLQGELDQYKLQLDGLAIRVDQQQARNEEQFVNLNTQIVQNTNDLVVANGRISTTTVRLNNLSIEVMDLEETTIEKFDNLYGRVNNLDSSVQVIEEEQNEQKSQLGDITTLVQNQANDIRRIENNVNQLSGEIVGIRQSVNNLITELTGIDNRLVSLEAMGPIKSGRTVVLWDYQSGGYSTTIAPQDIVVGTANYSAWSGSVSGPDTEWFLVPSQYYVRPSLARPAALSNQIYWVRIVSMITNVQLYAGLGYVYMS